MTMMQQQGGGLLAEIAKLTSIADAPGYAEFRRREQFVKEYSWAIPTEEALQAIAKFANEDIILEIGAGKGLWANLLRQQGCRIIATDLELQLHGYILVLAMDAVEAVKTYQAANVLFTCWPGYNQPHTFKALKEFKGNKLVYIGEGFGGCTGDDDFHNEISENWEQIGGDVWIPQWFGIHDRVELYSRKMGGGANQS